MKKTVTFLLTLIFVTGVYAQQPASAAANEQTVKLASTADSSQYILGAYLGQFIASNGFVVNNANLFLKGMDDAMNKRDLLINPELVSKWIAEYQGKVAVERSIQLEKQLFESIKGKPGVGILPDGVCYTIVKTGAGLRPQPNDSVTLQVKGFLPDGSQFEDTYVKNKPYHVTPAGLIPGMNEVVQIMPEGSVWKLYIPSALAFGEKGLQGLIPPYSAVVYEVELVHVKR